jgi:hypothetical protein
MADGMRLAKTELFQVDVTPIAGNQWSGLFGELPDAKRLEEALQIHIDELDPNVEHEFDLIRDLYGCALQLIKHSDSELFEDIRVADVYIGSITLNRLEVFKYVQEAMMPELERPHEDA